MGDEERWEVDAGFRGDDERGTLDGVCSIIISDREVTLVGKQNRKGIRYIVLNDDSVMLMLILVRWVRARLVESRDG